MLLNLDFANNTILSCFFYFLIIKLYFLIPEMIAQIFHSELLGYVHSPLFTTYSEKHVNSWKYLTII